MAIQGAGRRKAEGESNEHEINRPLVEGSNEQRSETPAIALCSCVISPQLLLDTSHSFFFGIKSTTKHMEAEGVFPAKTPVSRVKKENPYR